MCASFLYYASGLAPAGRHPSESRRRYLVTTFLKYVWFVLIFVAAGYSWFVGSR